MTHISYSAPKYPFVLVQHNMVGLIESETTFEGYVTYLEDDDTQDHEWEVDAYVTGFTQYQNGKQVVSVSGIKSRDYTVIDEKAFEAACVDAAVNQFKIKKAA